MVQFVQDTVCGSEQGNVLTQSIPASVVTNQLCGTTGCCLASLLSDYHSQIFTHSRLMNNEIMK